MKDTQTYTEQELVALLKQRAQPAFSYLYDHYSAALNSIIVNIVADTNIAADVLQEVFVKVWRQIEQYDPEKGRLFTWMHKIARSTAIDLVRSKNWRNHKRNNSLTDEYNSIADQNQHPSEKNGLRKLVQSLKEDHKILVELSYFQGYTQDEIAQMLQLPLGTVKTRLRAALIQLRQQVKI